MTCMYRPAGGARWQDESGTGRFRAAAVTAVPFIFTDGAEPLTTVSEYTRSQFHSVVEVAGRSIGIVL